MPLMTGWEVIDACRADPAMRQLPIIVTSAIDGGQPVEQLRVQAFLPKPFDIDDVLTILAELIS
jgi:CheY-like chemotaxis protein